MAPPFVEGEGITDEQVAQLKADYPDADLHWIQAGGHEGVFRSPPYAEWKRFKALFLDQARRGDALETLVYGCLVHPSALEFRKVINRKPALAEVFGERLAALAGMGAETVEKKL